MTKVSSTNEYAVYEIDLGRSDGKMQETKRAGKDRLFDKILNIFGDKSSFHIEDFESSKFLSLIGEDTIISQIGPPSLAQSNDSKSSIWKEL